MYEESTTIEDYPVTLFVTREGYVKKVTVQSLRSTTSEHKLKEDDEVARTIETTNRAELLYFTDKASVYKTHLYDLPDGKVSALGEYMPAVLGVDKDEKLLYAAVTTDFAGFMLFCFENGKMARVPLSAYATKTNRKKLIGAYSDKAAVVSMLQLTEETDMAAFTDNNKALVFNTDKIPEKSTKSTQGVQVMKLTKKGARMTRVVPLGESDLEDPAHFRTKNIPAAGSFLRKDDIQLSLF